MKKTNHLIVAAGILTAFLALSPGAALAKLKVITTTPDLGAAVREIGGGEVELDVIAKGTQDPHAIEAKPSYMVKMAKADLVVAIGLDLEVGWLPSIQRGARNPKILGGEKGYLEVGPLVDRLEVATGNVSREEGDVHPFGNPHITIEPIRMGQIAVRIAERMGELDPPQKDRYLKNASALKSRLADKSKAWAERIKKSGVQKVITYHKTLDYFLDRYGIKAAAILEPKPGIPPTSSHTLDVIHIMKDQGVKLVLIENYFDPSAGRKIQEEIPGVKVSVVPVSVEGSPEIKTLDQLYETLTSAIETGGKK